LALSFTSALAAPVPKDGPPKDGFLALWGQGKPTLLRSDGTLHRDLSHADYGTEGDIAVSPDGKRVALLVRQKDELLKRGQYVRIHKLYVRGIDEQRAGVELPAADLTFRDRLLWSPDGKRLYAESGTLLSEIRKAVAAGKEPPFGDHRTVVFDVAAGNWSAVPLGWDSLIGVRPDGKLVVASESVEGVRLPDGRHKAAYLWRWHLTDPDGKVSSPWLTDPSWHSPGNNQLSADGKRVLSVTQDSAKHSCGLAVVDLEKMKRAELAVPGLPRKDFLIERARWSPDGKRIAFYYMTLTPDPKEPWYRWERSREAKLCVCDADGKRMKVIRTDKVERFHYFEWK